MNVGAIDPGGTSGLARVEANLQTRVHVPVEMSQAVGDELLWEWLTRYRDWFDVVVVEDFFVRPESMLPKGKRDFYRGKWTGTDTPKTIGLIKGFCWSNQIKFVLQQPAEKAIGQRLTGVVPTSSSDPKRHQKDALNHAYIFLHHERRKLMH